MKIDVKAIIENQQKVLLERVKELKDTPRLCTILVGENPASKVYVKKKSEVLAKLNMENDIVALPDDIEQDTLEAIVKASCEDEMIHGILIQLPLPKHIDTESVLRLIPSEKDVDGFSVNNLGELLRGGQAIKPCTPAGVMNIFKGINYSLEGKKVLIVGRSNILGKPLAVDMINNSAIVSVTHSKAKTPLKTLIENINPNVIIGCAGVKDLIDASMIALAPDCEVIIDCAIIRTENGLRGDFRKEDYHFLDDWGIQYTAVPGGVGLTTTTMVAENLLRCYKIQKEN